MPSTLLTIGSVTIARMKPLNHCYGESEQQSEHIASLPPNHRLQNPSQVADPSEISCKAHSMATSSLRTKIVGERVEIGISIAVITKACESPGELPQLPVVFSIHPSRCSKPNPPKKCELPWLPLCPICKRFAPSCAPN